MEPWEIEARECIRDLVARYNASGDFGKFDAVLALFSEDAVMELPLSTHRGHAEIRSIFEGVTERTGDRDDAHAKFIRHFTATHCIDVESEANARGTCYYAVFTEAGPDHWGRYLDGYRRVDGRWLFERRRVTVDGCRPGSSAAPHVR